ncbi:hypothetical protein HWV62_12618 [Athelia sp. TMB]|nr:hypothetical protein HWV62_12618 [Athelia sp. TMB]
MANIIAKDKLSHYTHALHNALLSGQYDTPSPSAAVTPNGAPLEWAELLRKFTKHTQRAGTAGVARNTRELGMLIPDDTPSVTGKGGEGELALGRECVLADLGRTEADAGYAQLQALDAGDANDSRNMLLAFYAYALDDPGACLAALQRVPSFAALSYAVRKEGENPEGVLGPAELWSATETLRSLCLQGMSHERLGAASAALASYRSAISIIIRILASVPPTSSPSTSRARMEHKELWGWVERLLFRAIALSATQGADADMWQFLGEYRQCAARWSPTFRPVHRGIIARLHMRALILALRATPSSPFSDAVPIPNSTQAQDRQRRKDLRAVATDYRAVLSSTTKFPKAGERNTGVEEYVDLCVAGWQAAYGGGKAGGGGEEGAGWVVDILWWATRLTFNSPRVFRHMTRVFAAAGDTALARRTLRLYATLVAKAYETQLATATGTASSTPSPTASEEAIEKADVDADADSDANWVDTLVFGARMLCRPQPPPFLELSSSAPATSVSTALEDAQEAQDLLRQARVRLDPVDKPREAALDLAEGVASTALALASHDPRTRPAILREARAKFERSVEVWPSAEGWWHLAVALARGTGDGGKGEKGVERDLERAVAAATRAVEAWGDGNGSDGDVRYWHLLGLLLSAQGKWAQARGVLEVAAALGPLDADGAETEDDLEALPTNGHANGNGNAVQQPTTQPDTVPEPLLPLGARAIPPAHTLLLPLPDHPRASRQDAFARALQLRMSQVALLEAIEGPEGAAVGWVSVFGWVAKRNGNGAASGGSTRRSSMDTARVSVETRLTSEYAVTQPSEGGNTLSPVAEKQEYVGNGSVNGTGPVPQVTVTPATPAVGNDAPFGLGKRSGSIDQDSTKGKKVQAMLHKSSARISTIGKKIGNGMVRRDSISSLKRSTSAPDFHSLLQHNPYQASSIHSRRRLSFVKSPEPSRTDSPPPPPSLSPNRQEKETKLNMRVARENRLLSDLWLMSAATFRRLGKIEQAKGAIQEAEVKDEDNPAVWVQLGLYYMALEHQRHAIDAFHKALFISPDDVSAAIHLARIYLTPSPNSKAPGEMDRDNIDLAAGMLAHAVKGSAWDIPEAWYYLAKAYNLQGRKDKEREALAIALKWSEQRSIRDIELAVGWCL